MGLDWGFTGLLGLQSDPNPTSPTVPPPKPQRGTGALISLILWELSGFLTLALGIPLADS
jgi:hypothetical protein